VDNSAKAAVILNTKLSTSNFNILPNNIIRLYDYVDSSEIVSKTFAREGVLVKELMPMGDSLEEYFSKVIGGRIDD